MKKRNTLVRRVAKLEARVKRVEATVAKHLALLQRRRADVEYCKGRWVDDLGSRAVGVCVLAPDSAARSAVFKVVLAVWPKGAVVCHRCDTPMCVRPDHLFPGTMRDNARDCILKGRRFPGRVALEASLVTWRAELFLLRARSMGVSMAEMARLLNI